MVVHAIPARPTYDQALLKSVRRRGFAAPLDSFISVVVFGALLYALWLVLDWAVLRAVWGLVMWPVAVAMQGPAGP